jgi:hypothetical protein
MKNPKPFPINLKPNTIVAGTLWLISATLTGSLFVSLAGGSFFKGFLLLALAGALEAGKILTWLRGGLCRIFAVALICLSIFASLGAAVQTIESAHLVSGATTIEQIHQSTVYKAKETELGFLDAEISTTTERLKNLPADYPTAAKNLTSTIAGLHQKRDQAVNEMTALEAGASINYDPSNLFVLVGKTIGVKPEILMFIVLMFLAVAIELGALILASPPKPRKGLIERSEEVQSDCAKKDVLRCPTACPIGPKEFLQAMIDGSDLPYLHGRDKIAQKLGVRPYNAKLLVKRLAKEGLIETDGKRLKLTPFALEKFKQAIQLVNAAKPVNSDRRVERSKIAQFIFLGRTSIKTANHARM